MSTLRVRLFQRENGLCDNVRDVSIDDRIRLDFDQHFGVDEVDKNHGGCGADIAENLAVRTSHILPERTLAHEHTRAHHVARLGSCFSQCGDDDFETAFGLRIRVARGNDVTRLTDGRSTGDKNLIGDAYGA